MKAKLQWVQYSMPCELWCLPFWLVGPGTVPGSVWDLGTVCKSFFSASFPKPSTWGGPSADYSFLFGSPFPVCCPTDAIQYHGLHSDSSLLCLDTPPLCCGWKFSGQSAGLSLASGLLWGESQCFVEMPIVLCGFLVLLGRGWVLSVPVASAEVPIGLWKLNETNITTNWSYHICTLSQPQS